MLSSISTPVTESMDHDFAHVVRMLQSMDNLIDRMQGYTPVNMVEWAQIREHFRQERKRRNLKQEWVAKIGRLDQSIISKIESDATYTPQLESFIKAIYGLGMTVVEFFAPLEGVQFIAGSGKEPAKVSRDAAGAPLPAVTSEELQAFVLDFIDKLQDLNAGIERRRTRSGASAKTPPKTRRARRG
jgi:transcriptional regulator with XRE-family HTH domain